MKILLTEGFHDEHTLEIKLNESALDDLLSLLKTLKIMTNKRENWPGMLARCPGFNREMKAQ